MAKKKKKTKVYIARNVILNKKITKKISKANNVTSSAESGQMGTWGGIIFCVSESKILPMQDMEQELNGKWAEHDVIGEKAKSEFQGAELRDFTITTIADVQFGHKPHAVMKKFNQACEKGKVSNLIIGTHKIGTRPWKLMKVSEQFDLIYSGGELARAKINLTFREY